MSSNLRRPGFIQPPGRPNPGIGNRMEAWMRSAVCLLALLAWPALVSAQKFPSLEQTLQLASGRGYQAQQVQWPKVTADARAIASSQGEDAAIRFVLAALKDGHSFYIAPAMAIQPQPRATSGTAVPAKALSELAWTPEGIPVIRVNGWTGSQTEAVTATAALRTHVAKALVEHRCGVILDFSGNSGGNMWPMLVGLSPLLTEGAFGYFEDATGSALAIEKRNGSIAMNGPPHPLNTATTLLPKNIADRIALVVGPGSASSGEIVPIMFHGQDNTRFFGRPTSGHSTANATFPLPNGGFANITTAVTLDRKRKKFGGQITPEIPSEQPLAAAARWIAAGCTRK